MQSCVLIHNVLFEERGTHWCWKYLTVPNRVGRAFPDTALDSLPYLDPARARRMGISSLFCEIQPKIPSLSKLLLGHPSCCLAEGLPFQENLPCVTVQPTGKILSDTYKHPSAQQGGEQNETAEAIQDLPVEGRRATVTQNPKLSLLC